MYLQVSTAGLKEQGENDLNFYFSGTSGEQLVPKIQNLTN